jgi:hypothetical protein
MAFKKNYKNSFKPKAETKVPAQPAPAGPLMDPVLYVGDLDLEKYPRLEQKQDDRNTQEVENPLNQRR